MRKLMNMLPLLVLLWSALLSLWQASAFAQKSDRELAKRIAAAHPGKVCEKTQQCRNPVIVQKGNYISVEVVTPGHTTMNIRTEDLREYLLSLPMSAWPSGPYVKLRTTDLILRVTQSREEWNENMSRQKKAVQEVCADLGLTIINMDPDARP